MSPLMRHYIAGLVANLPEIRGPVICPTINSYKRTVPGAWAPINATWGVDNRTTAVRAMPGGSKSTRIELRLSVRISIRTLRCRFTRGRPRWHRAQARLPPPTVNAYAGDAAPLPRTLAAATKLFRESKMARCWLGDEFVDHYAGTREWEVRQFDKAVTDWELARYMESI